MVWDYRIMRYEDGSLGIHEVYYTGNKKGWTQDAVGLIGDDEDELRCALKWMMECLEKPILDYKTGAEIEK